jgi:CHASE3 domain sensor protein
VKIRIPPFLPAHTILVLALAYAAASLWLGLNRLESIAAIADSGTQSAATVQGLEGLLIDVGDIETAARGYMLTGDERYLEPFDRGRRNVPGLLSELRDRMRDDPTELATIERLVPLIAARTETAAAGIERKRSAPDKPYTGGSGGRGKEASDEIRRIVMDLVGRERGQLARDRTTLENTLREARRDMYLMSALTLLVVVLLYYAVRRLRAFIPFEPVIRVDDKVDAAPADSPASRHFDVAALISDALLRARLAFAAAAPASAERAHLQSLVATLEDARDKHLIVAQDLGQPLLAEQDVAQAEAASTPARQAEAR